MQKAETQKKSRLPHEAYLKHFINELHIDIPLWAFVDLLTISNISLMYKISASAVKIAVANSLGLKMLVERFMHQMTIIRNLCAHDGRLYNRLFKQRPWLNRKELGLLIKEANGTVDNAHLYSFILVIKRLLKEDKFSEMKSEIIKLTKVYPFVNMRYYGFRADWKTVL